MLHTVLTQKETDTLFIKIASALIYCCSSGDYHHHHSVRLRSSTCHYICEEKYSKQKPALFGEGTLLEIFSLKLLKECVIRIRVHVLVKLNNLSYPKSYPM